MEQYKIGDKVRVVKRIGKGNDYPFCYTDEMVEKFEGKIVTISEVKPNWCFTYDKKFYNDDSTGYHLKEDATKFEWHSSMFEPVNAGIGSKITVGNFTGEISKNLSNKWHLSFGNATNHAKICQTLHDDIDGFFKLAKAFGAPNHSLTTCFPAFESLESLLQFVEELNKCLANKASNSLKTGDPIWIGKIKGRIDLASERYYIFFKNENGHRATCIKLRELIPNFDSLAVECGTTYKSCPIDCFPTFLTLEKLLQFVAIINNQLNNPQKIQKNENRFQKPKASVIGGSVPEGRKISGRKDKIAISSGCLSYRVCDF